jgi:hypothetical protein
MGHVHGRAIVLLEGLDKVGKTTMARELAGSLATFGPVELVHFEKPPPGRDPLVDYASAIVAAHRFEGSTVIDRAHWSEDAYGQVYRPGAHLPTRAVDALDELLRAVGGCVVWRTRQVELVHAFLDDDDHATKGRDVTEADLHGLHERFAIRYRKRLVPAVRSRFPEPLNDGFYTTAADLRSAAVDNEETR